MVSNVYCWEYFNVFEYLVWASHEVKSVSGILAKPAPKKGKTITTETLHLVIIYCLQDKRPNVNKVNTEFSEFCTLRPKWCVLAGSKMPLSVCLCSAQQNVVLLVDVVGWDLTYNDPIKLTLFCLKYFH